MLIDNTWNMKANRNKALMLAKRELAVFVLDAVELEGIHFTLPEIQTLLEGISVGGHKLSDQQIALNQGNTWKSLFQSIATDEFELSAHFTCQLHHIAAKEEALEWGQFRSGGVTIAGTDYLPPKATDLQSLFNKMLKDSRQFNDVYDKAIFIFLTMARNQFFYDVNKRMGRFMMNGILLSAGFPAINLPASRQLEFNQLMLDFYQSGNYSPMTKFMRSCLKQPVIDIMNE
jgi:Fic family protein